MLDAARLSCLMFREVKGLRYNEPPQQPRPQVNLVTYVSHAMRIRALVAQWIEPPPSKRVVVGSNPTEREFFPSPGSLAQRQSSCLLSNWFQVRIPDDPPILKSILPRVLFFFAARTQP